MGKFSLFSLKISVIVFLCLFAISHNSLAEAASPGSSCTVSQRDNATNDKAKLRSACGGNGLICKINTANDCVDENDPTHCTGTCAIDPATKPSTAPVVPGQPSTAPPKGPQLGDACTRRAGQTQGDCSGKLICAPILNTCKDDGTCDGVCTNQLATEPDTSKKVGEGGTCYLLRINPDVQGTCNASNLVCTLTTNPTCSVAGWCAGSCKVDPNKPSPKPPQPPPPSPPCAQYDGTGRCLQVVTGFGNISTDPAKFITALYGIILSASGGIAVLLLMRAGYRIQTSRGNPQALKEGNEQATATIVGLLFLILAFILLQVIASDILKIPGITP